MSSEEQNSRLLELTREFLGAKGMVDLIRELLATLSTEDKRELTMRLFQSGLPHGDWSYREMVIKHIAELFPEELKETYREIVVSAVREGLEASQETIVKEMLKKIENDVRADVQKRFSGKGYY